MPFLRRTHGAAQLAAGARIARPLGTVRSADRDNVRARAVARVDEALRSEALQRVLVEGDALALQIGPVRPADVWAFVPIEPQRAQLGQLALDEAGTYPRAIEILDPEHEVPAGRPRRKPGDEGGAQRPEVKLAGWTGRKAAPDMAHTGKIASRSERTSIGVRIARLPTL